MKPKEYKKRLLQQDSMIVKFYIWLSQKNQLNKKKEKNEKNK